MLDVSCCKANGVPQHCLGICEAPDSTPAFRKSLASPPTKCDDFKALVNDQCIVAFTSPGNLQITLINVQLF